ncbi:hypothetical protein Hanom_Chr05g00460241 [Helianthus anomalus]
MYLNPTQLTHFKMYLRLRPLPINTEGFHNIYYIFILILTFNSRYISQISTITQKQ